MIGFHNAAKWMDFDFAAAGFTDDQRKSILTHALNDYGRDCFPCSRPIRNGSELRHSPPHDSAGRNPESRNGPRRRNNGSRPLAS